MQCDVAVVGAGPAGATAARFLAESGLQVIIVEKDKLPKQKPCGGMITSRVFERFQYLNEKREQIAVSPSYGTCLHPPSLTFKVPYFTAEPQGLLILRKKFDYTLVQMATDNGADLVTGRVKDVIVKPQTAKLLLQQGAVINSRVIVGADGVNSIVAKKTGLTPTLDRDKTAVCAVSELEIGKKAVKEYFGDQRPIHLFLGFGNLFGYAWVFPKRSHVNIGLGGILSRNRDIPRKFTQFIKILKIKRMIPQNLPMNNYSVALIPSGGPLERTYQDRVVLCGDAAGFVHPLTGEGIYYAMASGKIASQIITPAIEKGSLRGHQLSAYHTAWMKDFGKELKRAANLQTNPSGIPNILETGTKLAKADKKLTEMLANICLSRTPLNKTTMGKIILRFPISTAKHFYQKIFGSDN